MELVKSNMVVEISDSIGPVPFAVAMAFLSCRAVTLAKISCSGAGDLCCWVRDEYGGGRERREKLLA